MKKIISGIVIILFYLNSYAQESVSGLLYYPGMSKDDVEGKTTLKSLNGLVDTLNLPFFDDFVQDKHSPDPSKWLDNYVYINQTLAVDPPSIGVATFDAIDANGRVYTNYSSPFFADTLTSQPIKLDYSSSKNIVMSFFYQPQGIADNPEEEDSLILQFRAVTDTGIVWNQVWRVAGSKLTDFQYVGISINEAQYLYSGFQFRFVNVVSFPKTQNEPEKLVNCDHWHIDYVYVDTSRVVGDGSFDDVAITKPIRGILNNYSSIPSRHFPEAYDTEKASYLDMTYKNLNLTEINSVERWLRIEYNGNIENEEDKGKENIEPDTIETVEFRVRNISLVNNPPDYAEIDITSYLVPDETFVQSFLRKNDTIKYTQIFDNYYAYDDGSPENGYNVSGDGSNINNSIACRYDIFQKDTLQAIQIYFIPTKHDTTDNLEFILKVWSINEDGKTPGDTLYTDIITTREIGATGKYNQYVLERPLYLPESFFIGFTQLEDKCYNVGLDRSYNHQDKLYFFMNNQWTNSSLPETEGCIMIRPVVGDKSTVGIIPDRVKGFVCNIFPIPANDFVTIDIADQDVFQNYYLSVYDITGKIVYAAETIDNTIINVSDYAKGLYIFKVSDDKGAFITRKVLVSH